MSIDSADPSTNNVDAEQAPAASTTSRMSDSLAITPEETALAERWTKDVEESRTFDQEVRRKYARDRSYARGESSSVVQHSLIMAYIDILVAFLVARDPDFDCPPAPRVGTTDQLDAEAYGKTMTIVVSYELRRARLKRLAIRLVRSALSVGVGILKGVWHEDYATDPKVSESLRDVQKNLAQLEAIERDLQEGERTDYDLKLAEQRELESSLQANLELVTNAGMSLAFINPEDMVYSIESDNIVDVVEMPWMGHFYYLTVDNAKAAFTRIPTGMIDSATKYAPRKPTDGKGENGAVVTWSPEDADSFTAGGDGGNTTPSFVRLCEIWDADTGKFFTIMSGVKDRFAREPIAPPATTERFHPFFVLSFTEVDGQRHPDSLVGRSYKMQDEIDRSLNSFVAHRSRTRPGMVYDSSMIDPTTVTNLTRATEQEYVGVKLKGPPEKRDLRRSMMPKAYAQIDMAIYDISPFIRCMETEWGVQEAMTGTVQVAKTATEADIQQAGTQAKSGHKRDVLEMLFTDLGNYTAEYSGARLELQDVQLIAGSQAYWIPLEGPQDMQALIQLEVRAGSTGKPDKAGRRDAWLALSDKMAELIGLIGDMRQSTPLEMADCYEALMVEMADRLGERIDIKQFIPDAAMQPMLNPITGQPVTGQEAQQLQMAMLTAPPPGAEPEGGKGGDSPPPDEAKSGQDTLAPTGTPSPI